MKVRIALARQILFHCRSDAYSPVPSGFLDPWLYQGQWELSKSFKDDKALLSLGPMREALFNHALPFHIVEILSRFAF